MAAFSYSLFTVFGVLIVGTGLALQILYIKNDQNFETYLPHQIASLIINTLVVCYLMFVLIFYRPYSTVGGTALPVFSLLIGLALEFFANQFGTNSLGEGLEFALAGLNAAIRLYILIQVRCEASLTSIPEIINQVVKVAKTSGQPVSEVAKQVGKDLGTIDPSNLFQNIASNLGSISDLSPEKKGEIKDAVRKGLGLAPRVQQAGRRR
jgi:hypothetical protein